MIYKCQNPNKRKGYKYYMVMWLMAIISELTDWQVVLNRVTFRQRHWSV